MGTDEDDSRDGAGRVVPITDARIERLVQENRALREALKTARVAAFEMAALACAAAEVPSEAGGVWYLGLTDDNTRQACIDAVHRLLHAERVTLAEQVPTDPADVVHLSR